MTFASHQRPGIFDARQSCVKNNIKCAPTPLIRLSKIKVQLCYPFAANQRWSKLNFPAVQGHHLEGMSGLTFLSFSRFPSRQVQLNKLIYHSRIASKFENQIETKLKSNKLSRRD